MNDVKVPSKPVLFVRSLLFWIYHITSLVLVVGTALILFPLPLKTRYKIITSWAKSNVTVLKYVCKVDYKLEGMENIPQGAAVVLSNHQSTWETLALQKFLPEQVWAAKIELLRVPVFGWGLMSCEPIIIDRSSGKKALDQLVEQGTKKLDQGRWIVLYPEGTRVSPGEKRRYKAGGAMLAASADYPILPVAHNAGEFWPKHSFFKYPGTITMVFGPPIKGFGRDPKEVNKEVETWIRNKVEEISDPKRWNR